MSDEWKSKVYIPTLDYYRHPKWTTEQKLMFLVSNFYSPETAENHNKLVQHVKSCAEALDNPIERKPHDQS